MRPTPGFPCPPWAGDTPMAAVPLARRMKLPPGPFTREVRCIDGGGKA